MIDLLQITNDPALARRCDALDGMRLFVDLERHGKADRQAGRNTFISSHQLADVGRVRTTLRRSKLMVRVDPVAGGGLEMVDAVLAEGADLLMLPMFTHATELQRFCDRVAGRVPVVALLETADALHTLDDWIDTPGLAEVYVGLNDLHLSLRCRFMFEPLSLGLLDPVAQATHQRGIGFGFGGIARLDEGMLPGRDVLAEHLRLGSNAVILSRTFHRPDDLHLDHAGASSLEAEVARLRTCEAALQGRDADAVELDRSRVHQRILALAQRPA